MKRVKFFIFIILNLNGESFIKELAEDNIEKKISYSEVQNIINDNKQLRSKVKVLETENQKIKKELEGLDIQVLSKLKEELIESRRNFKDLQERFTLLQKKNDKMSSKFQEMQIVSH
jgi:pyruvate/2-oxoacid:ferredoxin oxidoreductase beta subunit